MKQKGFILVSMPLTFAVLFVSILVPLLFDFNAAVNKERASRAAIADGNRIFITVYQSICKFTNRVATKQEQEAKEFEQSLAQLAVTAQSLRQAATTDKEAETRSNHLILADGLDQLAKLGGTLSNDKNLGLSRLEALISHQRFYKISQPLAAQIDSSLALKSEALKKLRKDLDFKLLIIFVTVTVGTFFNLILTIALFKLLIGGLTNRIKVLSENAFRLTASAPLLAVENSGDELAMVENAFLQMASELQTVEAAKQDYLSAISHDFRTPIASIIATMAATSRGLYGKLSAEGVKLTLQQGQKLDALTRTVNDLLTLERVEANMLELDLSVIDLASTLLAVEEKLGSQYSQEPEVLERLNFQNVAAELLVSCDSDKLVLVLQRLVEAAVIDSCTTVTVGAKAEKSNALITITYKTPVRRPNRKYLLDRSETKYSSEDDGDLLASFQTSLILCQALIERLDGEIIVLCDQMQHSFIIKLKLLAGSEVNG